MELIIRGKTHKEVVKYLAKYYNKRAWIIFRLPDSNHFMCRDLQDLPKKNKELDTTIALKNLKPTRLKDW